ncbi:hypothetical protein D3C81_2008830 [compost metagenome]
MIVHQRQLRAHVLGQQVFALQAVARGPDLATPARQQAVHAGEDAVLVVDAEHLGAGQGLAIDLRLLLHHG